MLQPSLTAGSHYGPSMKAKRLRAWSEIAARRLVQYCTAESKIPVLMYRGMSGVAAATALSLQIPENFRFIMAYVRKPEEESHGKPVQWADSHQKIDEEDEGEPYEQKDCIFVVVDDFISSGDTVCAIINGVQKLIGAHLHVDSIFSLESEYPNQVEILNEITKGVRATKLTRDCAVLGIDC